MKKAISITLEDEVLTSIKDKKPSELNLSQFIEVLLTESLEAREQSSELTMKQALIQVNEVYKRDMSLMKGVE